MQKKLILSSGEDSKTICSLAGIQLTVAPSQSIVSSHAGKIAIISLTGSYSSSQFDMFSI
jgi:hypothetical protein